VRAGSQEKIPKAHIEKKCARGKLFCKKIHTVRSRRVSRKFQFLTRFSIGDLSSAGFSLWGLDIAGLNPTG
jgi:hypothetical protein